jgi:hypothetical protein
LEYIKLFDNIDEMNDYKNHFDNKESFIPYYEKLDGQKEQ